MKKDSQKTDGVVVTKHMNPKIKGVGIAGSITSIIVWMIGEYTVAVIPPEIAAAITTVVAFAIGWLVPDGAEGAA